jgi:hypothetical protein
VFVTKAHLCLSYGPSEGAVVVLKSKKQPSWLYCRF